MASFEIPDVPLTAPVRTERVGERVVRTGAVRFTVTNKTGFGVTGQASILPEGEARKEWFTLDGEAVRPFSASSTQVFPVKFTAPDNVPAGRYAFRFRVTNENDPDNDFSESPMVVFDLPATVAVKPPVRWWPFALAGAVVLLVVVGVAIFLLTRGGGPDLAGQWQTNVGPMALTQKGGKIEGDLLRGRILLTGTVKGERVTGFWRTAVAGGACPEARDGNKAWGRFEWTFPEPDRFQGGLAHCDNPLPSAPNWTGERAGPAR